MQQCRHRDRRHALWRSCAVPFCFCFPLLVSPRPLFSQLSRWVDRVWMGPPSVRPGPTGKPRVPRVLPSLSSLLYFCAALPLLHRCTVVFFSVRLSSLPPSPSPRLILLDTIRPQSQWRAASPCAVTARGPVERALPVRTDQVGPIPPVAANRYQRGWPSVPPCVPSDTYTLYSTQRWWLFCGSAP